MGTGFGVLRGRLVWPAVGKVVGEYGAQIHPRSGRKRSGNGIDIDVAEGTSIHAVYAGHVVYTGWFRGYGNMIIVDHGGEYYTLYAHAADVKVKEGDEVKQGHDRNGPGYGLDPGIASLLRGATPGQGAPRSRDAIPGSSPCPRPFQSSAPASPRRLPWFTSAACA